MEDKIYFLPGDVVVLNKYVSNEPDTMLVIGKSNDSKEQTLIGIKCLFFDKLGAPHEQVFSTKDIKLYKLDYAE